MDSAFGRQPRNGQRVVGVVVMVVAIVNTKTIVRVVAVPVSPIIRAIEPAPIAEAPTIGGVIVIVFVSGHALGLLVALALRLGFPLGLGLIAGAEVSAQPVYGVIDGAARQAVVEEMSAELLLHLRVLLVTGAVAMMVPPIAAEVFLWHCENRPRRIAEAVSRVLIAISTVWRVLLVPFMRSRMLADLTQDFRDGLLIEAECAHRVTAR